MQTIAEMIQSLRGQNVQNPAFIKVAEILERLYAGGAADNLEEGVGIDLDRVSDPDHVIISATFDPAKLKSVTDRTPKQYFKIPANFVTGLTAATTQVGALNGVTPTEEGSFDRFNVTGGNEGSYIRFENRYLSDPGSRLQLVLQINDLKAAPYIGVRTISDTALSIFNQSGLAVWFTPATSLFQAVIGTGTYNPGTDYNTGGDPFVINDGDIVEFLFQRRVSVYGHWWEAFIFNHSTGKFASRREAVGQNMSNIATAPGRIGIILADIDATILDFNVVAQDGEAAKVAILGDFASVGFNITYPDTIVTALNNAMIYRNIVLGGQGTTIAGFARSTIPELNVLKPQSVVLLNTVIIVQNWFKVGDTNKALFDASMLDLSKCVRSFGGIFILPKYQSLGSVTAPNMVLWNAWVDANAATYGAQILDLTGIATVYADDGFSFGHPFVDSIAEQIMAILTVQGLLP